MFDANEIRAATFVRHVEVHDTLGSTNDRAAELARWPEIELPALIVARLQTAGRGRGKNVWWSSEGALTFSLLLESETVGVSPEKWPRLSLTTAVAICDVLQQQVPQATVGIKWPNDVLLDGKKVSGILIESPGGTWPAKDRLIVGIGINVNNSLQGRDRGKLASGTALCDATTEQHDLQRLLIRTLTAFETRLLQLRNSDTGLADVWRTVDQLTGKQLIVESGSDRIEGVCEKLADDGALVLRTASGLRRIYSGSLYIK